MNNKTYLILLSPLIACSSWAMENSKDSVPKWVNYWSARTAQSRICKQIYGDIQKLKAEGTLTPETLLPRIQAQFPEGTDLTTDGFFYDFSSQFRDITQVTLQSEPLLSLHWTDDGKQIATVVKEKGRQKSVVNVWKEEQPKQWRNIAINIDEPRFVKWIHNSAQLLVLAKGQHIQFWPYAFDGALLMPAHVHENDAKSVIDEALKYSDLQRLYDIECSWPIEKSAHRRRIEGKQTGTLDKATITISDFPTIDAIAAHLCSEAQKQK
jgi:hypothetical protein